MNKQIISAIDEQIKQLQHARKVLVSLGSRITGNGVKHRRTMSAAGRKRIAAAQRARWAKIRAAKKK
jgi:hypothetical protein